MFKSARVRLTVLYCVIFFGVFWLASVGIFLWMQNSLGEGYVSKVTQVQVQQHGNHVDSGNDESTAETATIAGDITKSQLEQVLLYVNGALLFIVPTLAWILTGRTLKPIKLMYERQRQFVSDASHELRTPLTIVRGELDLALKRKRSVPEYETALRSTRQEVIRLQDLTDNLLTLSRADRGLLPSEIEAMDLNKLIKRVISRLRPYADEQKVQVSYQSPGRPVKVQGSTILLEQLFSNLLTNALKYSPVDSKVSVRVSTAQSRATVTIEDSGIGMSQDDIEHAFDRFYRADSARSDTGFGLGLTISKSIVEQHHGSINLESKTGQGTTVTVELPSQA